VKVSHLALIPELTPYDSERVKLVSLRYTFTVLCNLFVFILYLTTGEDSRRKYLVITITVLVVGMFANSIFWAGVKEPTTATEKLHDKSSFEGLDSTTSNESWEDYVEGGASTENALDQSLVEVISSTTAIGSSPKPPSLLHWFTVKDFYL